MTNVLRLKKTDIHRTEAEMFDDPTKRFNMWRKGQVSNPRWLNRENGHDFVTIKAANDLKDLEQYLAQADERLKAEYYNAFSTGRDAQRNKMVGLYDIDNKGDSKKTCIIVVLCDSLTMDLIALVEQYCGEE